MARIETYNKDIQITGKEKVIGSDIDGKTLNYEIDDLKFYINKGLPDQPEYLQDGVISGGIAWVQGLQYQTTNITCVIGGLYYEVPSQFITLETADGTFDRQDLITLRVPSVDGEPVEVVVRTGEPSVTPVLPIIPFSGREIQLSEALVKSNETEPNGVSTDLVYDENIGNPLEWDLTTNVGVSTINPNSEEHPYIGTKSIKIDMTNISDGAEIIFTSDSTQDLENIDSLHFYMRLENQLAKTDNRVNYMYVRMYNGSSQIGQEARLYDNRYGLDISIYETYQNIVIPISDFVDGLSLPTPDIDKIVFGFIGKFTDTEVFIDAFNLLNGVETTGSNSRFTDNIDTPKSYIGQAGKIPIVNSDETGLEFKNISGSNLLKVQRTLSASEINNIGTTPIELIPAQGVGTIINPISVITKLNWNSAPFTSNGLDFYIDTAHPLFIVANIISRTQDTIIKEAEWDANNNNILENSPLMVGGTDSGISGDSTVTIIVTYEVITLVV